MVADNRVALITGSSRGIGRAIALDLATTMRVVVNYRSNEGEANSVVERIGAAGGQAIAVQADRYFLRAGQKAMPCLLGLHKSGFKFEQGFCHGFPHK